MPSWYYFSKPSNIAFHDFTRNPENKHHIRSLLGLNLKFIPTPWFTSNNLIDTEERLLRSMRLHSYFKGDNRKSMTKNEKNIYTKSPWTPEDWQLNREVLDRGSNFIHKAKKLFMKRRGRSNLLPLQRRALAALQTHDKYIVCNCDKNLGPALIERDRYISEVLNHLSDTSTYEKLDATRAEIITANILKKVDNWLQKYMKNLSIPEKKYMAGMTDKEKASLPYFYMLIKAHKIPIKF